MNFKKRTVSVLFWVSKIVWGFSKILWGLALGADSIPFA